MEETILNRGKIKRSKKIYFMSYMPQFFNLYYSSLKANIDRLNDSRQLKKEFFEKLKYELNLDSPRSYNEKIQWKKLYDRNPLLTVTADKYAVRSYLKSVLGEKSASELLIPLYHVTDKPENIPFGELPEKFVVKPNHGSQMHIFVEDKNQLPYELIIKECKRWLKVNFGFYTGEWAYRNIKRKILVEKMLETETGEMPLDYKLYCFHGKCKLIRVSGNRFGEEVLSGYFDTDWNLLPFGVPGYKCNHPYDKPGNLGEMISLAECLSKPFDYVRVDLYSIGKKTYFGELTHYEASGMGRLEPESFDFMLGQYWNIEPGYWQKKPQL